MGIITLLAIHLQFTWKYNVTQFFYSQVPISFQMFMLSWTMSSNVCFSLLSKTVTVHNLQFHRICTLEHLCYVENGHTLTHTPCPHSQWEHVASYLDWTAISLLSGLELTLLHNQPESNSPQCGTISSAGGHCTHHSFLHHRHSHLALATFP
jgi:hypothetical protein